MNNIINEILKFKNERDWDQFHNIKDLLIGLNIEVGELQELMLWKRESEIKGQMKQIDFANKVSNEMADIFIFLIYLSDKLNINLEESVEAKLEIHKKHYPIEKSKGRKIKYIDINNEDNK